MAVIGAIGALYSGLFSLLQRRLLRHRSEPARL